jgi:hypothetical protein
MSTATDIATLLQSFSKGEIGTNMFINITPESPKICVSVFDIPSVPPAYAFGMSPVCQSRFVQIQTRDANPQAAADRCQECLDVLVSTGVTINSVPYQMLRPRSSAALLTRDENNLTVFYGEVEAVIQLG